jgi:hypothetical protein
VSISLHIVIDPGSEPISGCLEPEGAAPRPFTGWLELTARLADAVSSARAAPRQAAELTQSPDGSTR